MNDKRGSQRIKEINKRYIVDAKTRKERQRRKLETLEKDNFQEDPHGEFAHLLSKAKLPSFDENSDGATNKKRRRSKIGEIFRQKAKRSFQGLLEELRSEGRSEDEATYLTAVVGEPRCPARCFCAVCGFFSKYTCPTCGTRYCGVDCLKTHKDTRCMKFTS